jgi:ketosteroid isomerase-like protein
MTVAPRRARAYATRMSGAELDVLEANAAFYRAFARHDVAAMAALWAERHPVACLHPGWAVVDGRDAVVESWRGILESGNAPEVSCSLAEARLFGDVALVTCHEILPGVRLAATNVFVREDGAWRIVHHQATPMAPGQARPSPPPGPAN